MLSCNKATDNGTPAEQAAFKAIFADANKLFNEGKIDESVKFMDSVYARQQRIPRFGRYLACSFKTLVYYQKKDLHLATLYADSALAMISDAALHKAYPGEYVHSLLEKGLILVSQHNFDKAYEYYSNALQQARATMNTCSLNEYYHHIGMALFREHAYVKSADYFKEGFAAAFLCPEADRPYMRVQEILDNIGLAYHQQNKWDTAVYYFDSCLSFISNNEGHFTDKKVADEARAVAYENKSISLLYQQKFDAAEECLKKGIELSTKIGADVVTLRSEKVKLATIYIDAQKYEEANVLIKDVMASLDTLPDRFVYIEMTDLLTDYYMNTGQYKKGAYSMLEVIRYKDSTSQAVLKTRESEVLRDLKEKDQQYRIQLLQKDNRYQATRSKVIITFALMALAILAMIFVNYRRARKNEQLLAASNREISAQKAALEKSNLEKDRILSVVAHDLRNPIGAVTFLADMLLDDEAHTMSLNETVGMIKKSSVGALHLINELVGFAGHEQGEVKLQPTDVTALVKETMQMMDYKLKEKKQAIICDVPGEPMMVNLDRDKIIRVVANLVGNAVKFTPEGGTIGIEAKRDGNVVLIAVKDNGIGIPQGMITELFGTSGRARRQGTSGEKSFGLGLSISRQIVEAHNGKIWVESEEGKGSTFFVELPA